MNILVAAVFGATASSSIARPIPTAVPA